MFCHTHSLHRRLLRLFCFGFIFRRIVNKSKERERTTMAPALHAVQLQPVGAGVVLIEQPPVNLTLIQGGQSVTVLRTRRQSILEMNRVGVRNMVSQMAEDMRRSVRPLTDAEFLQALEWRLAIEGERKDGDYFSITQDIIVDQSNLDLVSAVLNAVFKTSFQEVKTALNLVAFEFGLNQAQPQSQDREDDDSRAA